jgi:aryl-alcohol dehydrogenase-like predicted oxidoreductase
MITMKYKHLGGTGLQVSGLALGTMNFGELTSATASFEIMDTALGAGINFFDTADVYGGLQSPDMEKGFGTSEEIIGRWLAQGGRRDRNDTSIDFPTANARPPRRSKLS